MLIQVTSGHAPRWRICSHGIWRTRTSDDIWGAFPQCHSVFKWYIIKSLPTVENISTSYHSTLVKKWEQDSVNVYSEILITIYASSFITKVRKISIYRIIGGFNKMMHVKWLKYILVSLALFVAFTTISEYLTHITRYHSEHIRAPVHRTPS